MLVNKQKSIFIVKITAFILITLLLASCVPKAEADSIAIIGGADGPTAIFVTDKEEADFNLSEAAAIAEWKKLIAFMKADDKIDIEATDHKKADIIALLENIIAFMKADEINIETTDHKKADIIALLKDSIALMEAGGDKADIIALMEASGFDSKESIAIIGGADEPAAIYLFSMPSSQPLNAAESDPAKMGWMVGSPPPANRIIRFADGSYFNFPAMRWSVSNFRQLMPTVNVSKGLKAPATLPRNINEAIDNIEFIPMESNTPMTWKESLFVNFTDGIVILHKGDIVYEKYFGVLTEDGQHGAMSVTKSYIGTMAAMLVAEGLLDVTKQVSDYVPELGASAFGDATVRQVMDMTTGIKFSEDYEDPNAEIWAHAAAGNPLPKDEDYDGPNNYYESLLAIKKQGKHGEAFSYKTANTDALAWIIARITGKSVAQLLSEKIWSKLGAEQDGYFSVDSIGTPFAGGGLNTGLRDMARFGEMIRNNGIYNGEQIIPKVAIENIRKGGNPELFEKANYKLLKGWSYRDMWWITNNEHGAFTARGVYGQTIYIDPTAEMIIARFASHPTSFNSAIDPTSLPAYHAIAKYLLLL